MVERTYLYLYRLMYLSLIPYSERAPDIHLCNCLRGIVNDSESI